MLTAVNIPKPNATMMPPPDVYKRQLLQCAIFVVFLKKNYEFNSKNVRLNVINLACIFHNALAAHWYAVAFIIVCYGRVFVV